jgi:hypothetical protein
MMNDSFTYSLNSGERCCGGVGTRGGCGGGTGGVTGLFVAMGLFPSFAAKFFKRVSAQLN